MNADVCTQFEFNVCILHIYDSEKCVEYFFEALMTDVSIFICLF